MGLPAVFFAYSRLGNELAEGRRAGLFGDRRERILRLWGSWVWNANGGGVTMRSLPTAPA